jgi:hypothetical protein
VLSTNKIMRLYLQCQFSNFSSNSLGTILIAQTDNSIKFNFPRFGLEVACVNGLFMTFKL